MEIRKLKDYYIENVHVEGDLMVYDRKERALKVPVLFQGNENLCVPYTVLFLAAFQGGIDIKSILGTFMSRIRLDNKGSKPSQVLELARKMQLIPNYFYLKKLDRESISNALKISPLAIGVWNWWRVPNQGHFMALIDETKDGWLCVNWMNEKKHDFVTLPFDQPIQVAVAFADSEGRKANSGFFDALLQILISIYRNLCVPTLK
jgi:hypothetical protein